MKDVVRRGVMLVTAPTSNSIVAAVNLTCMLC
jgi:hypothetical protein